MCFPFPLDKPPRNPYTVHNYEHCFDLRPDDGYDDLLHDDAHDGDNPTRQGSPIWLATGCE